MALKLTPFDAAKYIETLEDQADLLNDAFQSGHAGYIAMALGAVARARGMTELAEKTGLNRQALYEALSTNGNPTLDTILRVSAALGFGLQAIPANEDGSSHEDAPPKKPRRARA
ncbi:MAG: putative addiction module antidote protein [Alphaproteobacteria bacterium]|nr:MAG: putative addiction module antidote protein [Alphaproteobacteria bacterium]